MCVRCGRRATEAPSILEHKLETRRSTACAQALGVLEHKLETRRSTACAQRTVVRRRCCLVARCPPLLSARIPNTPYHGVAQAAEPELGPRSLGTCLGDEHQCLEGLAGGAQVEPRTQGHHQDVRARRPPRSKPIHLTTRHSYSCLLPIGWYLARETSSSPRTAVYCCMRWYC